MELAEIVQAIAEALEAVDASCPAYVTRTGRRYGAGIGPYPENAAMELVVGHFRDVQGITAGQFASYPAASRQKCDLWLGDPTEWVIEVKMGRFSGDNGKPDDTGIKDLISPFRADRSALTDASKLAESGFQCRKAVVVYGFDDAERPLDDALDALDLLLRRRVSVCGVARSDLGGLRHAVFASGRVVAWEVAAAAPGDAAQQVSLQHLDRCGGEARRSQPVADRADAGVVSGPEGLP